MKSTTVRILGAIALALIGTQLRAAPIQWTTESGGNGHYYDLVIQTTTWPQAKVAAEGMFFQGVQGHLATITSQAESDFMEANLPLNHYWIGGYQDLTAPDFSEPNGGWRWVTGEPFDFQNWAIGEPNNGGGDERYLETVTGPEWAWNDLPANFQHGAFYIEYPVPEPASITLLSCGLVGLLSVAGFRRWLQAK